MAREHGLDLAAIAGSGPGGRIVRADILKVLEAGPPAPEKPAAPAPHGFLTAAEEIPIRGVRKVVFQNMHQSLQTQAQLTLHTEASADRLVEVRNQINETETLKIGYNAVFIKAVACALKRHPHINASVTGDVITVWKEIHIGLAVDVGKGLVVPKIRDAGNKTLHEIQTGLNAALEAARSGALMPDDLKEGTFTVTNLGARDIDDFTPIVNPPESAILGIGRLIEKPVVREGRLMVGKTVALSLTIDHRIIDGAPGAAFLKTIKEMIENPIKML
jgi:pyruvate/2-oxoglutarate dehydrogenase complex dihydrolipoamide acyltransferase (E2) component